MVNKDLTTEELKKVGSWTEKSGELLKKRAKVLLSSLMLALSPISLDELASILGYRSKERYRDDYVKPLKDNRLIEYTLERANDPNQQYVITNRGKLFLGESSILKSVKLFASKHGKEQKIGTTGYGFGAGSYQHCKQPFRKQLRCLSDN